MTTTTDTQQMMLYDANKKSVGLAYVLWFFLGWFGIHRFYAGRTGSGVAILVLTILGFITSVFGVGFIFLAVVGVWLVIDLFLVPGIIGQHNNNLIGRLRD